MFSLKMGFSYFPLPKVFAYKCPSILNVPFQVSCYMTSVLLGSVDFLLLFEYPFFLFSHETFFFLDVLNYLIPLEILSTKKVILIIPDTSPYFNFI